MTNAVAPTLYTAFGLRIISEFCLPELPQTTARAGEADVAIKTGDLSEAWNEYGAQDDYYAFIDGRFLFYVPEVAIYSIQGGKEIIVSPLTGAEEKSIRIYLLGTCMGAILMQRKTLPLHGSAVVINGQAYAFVGESGAGKSTLAAAFLNRGYPLLTDDVIAVSLGADGSPPVVIPAYPQQKLWQESIEQLGMESDGYRHLYLSKYAIPVASGFAATSVPLAGIFELTKTEGEEVKLSRYQGLERLAILRLHTYRHFLISHLAGEQWHFSTVAGIASRVDLYRLQRPSAGFSVHELVGQVLLAVLEGEKVMQG
ncbi:aldolase [Cohnella nanjingensis]|uniref:Aldolase n=1 Tax=Cohnella nanjingensis TaxID=1387779 RepID=A0A7X0VFP5_9BACL|nr:aldolase [Cohnella nanjingensis]MBB6672265.1 aldolase [Cohnella nanjingensis]